MEQIVLFVHILEYAEKVIFLQYLSSLDIVHYPDTKYSIKISENDLNLIRLAGKYRINVFENEYYYVWPWYNKL